MCAHTSHKLILSADEAHELYDLRIDPEEKLNIFGAPKADIHLQYTHCEDQSPVVATLAQMMCDRATQIKDWAGVELATDLAAESHGFCLKFSSLSADAPGRYKPGLDRF